jgi:ankyrin repeat protein
LHHAAASGDARIVEMLLEAGAEPDVKEQHDELGREMATEIGSASYIYIYNI